MNGSKALVLPADIIDVRYEHSRLGDLFQMAGNCFLRLLGAGTILYAMGILLAFAFSNALVTWGVVPAFALLFGGIAITTLFTWRADPLTAVLTIGGWAFLLHYYRLFAFFSL